MLSDSYDMASIKFKFDLTLRSLFKITYFLDKMVGIISLNTLLINIPVTR